MLSRHSMGVDSSPVEARAAHAELASTAHCPVRGNGNLGVKPGIAMGGLPVAALQRLVGNRAVGRMISSRLRASPAHDLVRPAATAHVDRTPLSGSLWRNATAKAVDDGTDGSGISSAGQATSTAGDRPASGTEPDVLPTGGPNSAGTTTGGSACAAIPTLDVKKVAPLSPGLSDDRWGLTQPESVTLSITACRQGSSWVPDVTGLLGNYSIQTRLLPPNQAEVTGPGGNTSQTNFCEQVRALDGLGKDKQSPNGAAPWFMLAAVDRHEQVHEAHLLPALQSAAGQIVRAVKQISVADDGTLDAVAAKAKIEATPAFQEAVKEAKVTWDLMLFDLVMDDHFSGATDKAEREVVGPMIKAICDEASKQSWGACPSCPP